MIRKLFILNLKALGANYFRSGKKKAGAGRIIIFTVIMIYACFTFSAMFFTFFMTMLEPFFSAGIGWMYFAFLALTAFGLSVMGSIFTASAQLFGAKDNELLLSMPIKPSDILLSRLFVILVFEYAFTLMVAIPAFILWINSEYVVASGVVFFFTGVFLLPLMAIALSLLLAWLLGVLTSKMRRKNIFVLALSIGFLAAYFFAMTNIQSYLYELLSRGEEIAQGFQRALPPFYVFGKSIAEGSAPDGLLFMLCAITPFAVSVILLSVNYRKILVTNRGAAKPAYKEKAAKAGSVFSALVRKELSHYWSRPSVVLNTSLGSLFMIVLSVIIIVKRAGILLYIDELSLMFGIMSPSSFAAIFLVFACVTNNLSSSLISLEGKYLWIVKSIPAPPKTILQSKLCVHLLISGLPCLIVSLCAAAVFAQSAADWLMLILLPQTVCVLSAVCGLAVNLRFPKLDWINEMHVVKQGLSAMLMIFGAMGIIAALVLAYAFLLRTFISLTAFLWLFTLLSAVAAFFTYAWLLSSGVKKFEGCQAL